MATCACQPWSEVLELIYGRERREPGEQSRSVIQSLEISN